jgi:hypothetical protein
MAKQFLAINRLLNGWGVVEGKFVYVPLWDPPKDRFKGYKEFYIASALKAAVPFVPEAFAGKVNELAKQHAGAVSQGILAEWDGDICPPFKVFPPRPNPPFPLVLVDSLPDVVKVGLAGHLIETLGDIVNNKEIERLGAAITGSIGNIKHQAEFA